MVAEVVVRRMSARASRNSGTTAVVGRAHRVNKSQASRWNRGLTKGPLYHVLIKTARAMERAGADSVPMLGEVKIMGALAAILADSSPKDVITNYYHLRDTVLPDKERKRYVAAMSGDVEKFEEALIECANAAYRLAAYIEAARELKLDLSKYDKFGNLKIRPR